MKKLFLLTILSVVLMPVCRALDTLKLETAVKEVTVFFDGAQVQREVALNIDRGARIIMLPGLPPDIVQSSIQVKNVNGCKILSVRSSVAPLFDNAKEADIKRLDKQVEANTRQMKAYRQQIEVFEREERILIDNSKLGTAQSGVKIAELKEAADFFRQRLNEIRTSVLKLEQQISDLVDESYRVIGEKNRIETLKNRTETRLFVTVDAESAIKDKLVFSYFITRARWTPSYDFRVSDVNEPLVLVYQAKVLQTSGEDWNDVKIKLSASNPTLTNNKPELPIWYAYRPVQQPKAAYTPKVYNTMPSGPGSGSIQGKITDAETGENIPFANIVIESNGRQVGGTSSDIDGKYRISPLAPGRYDFKISSLGYATLLVTNVIISAEQITFKNVVLNPTAEVLSQFIVTEYAVPMISMDQTTSGITMTSEEIRRMPGRSSSFNASSYDSEMASVRNSRSDGPVTYIDGVKVRGSDGMTANYGDYSGTSDVNNLIDNVLKTKVAHLEYQIETPYTIKSDGEDYLLRIKEVKVPVDYVYYIIPKKDPDAFLVGDIADRVPLNLLNGPSSVYFQGTFVGETYLDTRVLKDTLSVSLGRDAAIMSERTHKKELSERISMGNNYKQFVAWNIHVRNDKKFPVTIIVEENYPLTEYKHVVVELLEVSGGDIDVNKGRVSWKFVLLPGDKKEILFRYAIKYPKHQAIYFD